MAVFVCPALTVIMTLVALLVIVIMLMVVAIAAGEERAGRQKDRDES
jgi:hypothetical protein